MKRQTAIPENWQESRQNEDLIIESSLNEDNLSHLIENIVTDREHQSQRSMDFAQQYFDSDPKYSMSFLYMMPDRNQTFTAITKQSDRYRIKVSVKEADDPLDVQDIESFIKDTQEQSDYKIIFTTSKVISKKAQKLIDLTGNVGVITYKDIAASQILWDSDIDSLGLSHIKRKELREDQGQAVQAICEGFQSAARGQLILPCGTGKTFTSLNVWERISPDKTLYTVPRLSLVTQALEEFARNTTKQFDYLIVCSDQTTDRRIRKEETAARERLGVKITTEAAGIAEFLSIKSEFPKIVFSTYQSLDRVSEALENSEESFDLAIADEAHNCVGNKESYFRTILDNEKIPCSLRLYMTATPKVATEKLKKEAESKEIFLASMDDKDQFGDVFYHMSLGEAIRRNLVSDYKIVAIGVSKDSLVEAIREQDVVSIDELNINQNLRTLASQIALLKIISGEADKVRINKVFTFHNTVAEAKEFSEPDNPKSITHIVNAIYPKLKSKLRTFHADSSTTVQKRDVLMKEFEELPEDIIGIYSNCHILEEGTNVNKLNGVLFAGDRSSPVSISQIVGRVIRKDESKKEGVVIIPLIIDEKREDSPFYDDCVNNLVQILRTLRAHDERLAAELDRLNSDSRDSLGERVSFIVSDESKFNVSLKSLKKSLSARVLDSTALKVEITDEKIIDAIVKYAVEHGGELPTVRTKEIPSNFSGNTWNYINGYLRRNTDKIGLGNFKQIYKNTIEAKLKELGINIKIKVQKELPAITEEKIINAIVYYAARHNGAMPSLKTKTLPRGLGGRKWGAVESYLQRYHETKGLGAFKDKNQKEIEIRLKKEYDIELKVRLTEERILEAIVRHAVENKGKLPSKKTQAPSSYLEKTWKNIDAFLIYHTNTKGLRAFKEKYKDVIARRVKEGLANNQVV